MEVWNEIVLGKLGDTFTGLSGKTKDDFGFGSKYIQYVNIFNNSKIDIENLELVNVKSNEKQSRVKFGDIFFTTSSETIEEVGMSSVLLDEINEDIYLNSFCFGFRLFDFDKLLPEYAQHLLRAAHMRHSISMFGKGSTRYNLSKTLLLKDLVLVFPSSLTEQHKIATILNTLDQSISKTQKLISKYKNIKQGLMHDLLTYGIDENGTIRNPQTHTFVEKKGLVVPEEWEVEEIGSGIVKIATGSANTQDKVDDGIYPLFVRSSTIEKSSKYIFDCEAVLTSGDGVGVGKIYHYFNGKFNCHQRVYCIYDFDKNRLFGKYFFEYFKSNFYAEISRQSAKTTVDSVRLAMITKMLIKLPLFNEQQKIVSIINQEENLIESEQTNLAKLQNMKQGLMADLLTGKVRVKTESV